MKELILLRHAKSSWNEPGLTDIERPLSGRGKRACALLREALAQLHATPDLVLCSPARRTLDTLRRISPALPEGRGPAVEKRLYLASARTLLAYLRRLDDAAASILLVGHNPGLQNLALLLAGSGEGGLLAQLKTKFPTAAFAVLEHPAESWRTLEPGSATLTRLWTPRNGEAEQD